MIRVSWHDEDRLIISAEYSGDLTWEEFSSWDPLVREMLASVEHHVDGIVDMTHVKKFPPDYGMIVQGGHVEFPPKLDVVVLVGNRFAYDCMVAMSDLRTDERFPYRYAETLSEAYALIEAKRRGAQASSAPHDVAFLN